MGQKIVVIGAGVIGAAIALRLSEAGQQVQIIDAVGPATGASGRSFGWINASFYADQAHFNLRAAGIAAWQRLLPQDITWSGALWYEETGDAFSVMRRALSDLNYPMEEIDTEQFSKLEPHVAAPPERALRLPSEGAAETGAVTAELLSRAQAAGAQLLLGAAVSRIEAKAAVVTGVQTSAGFVPADRVIVAAGTGSPDLVTPLGVALPMLTRPGLLLSTEPLPPVLSHVLVSPGQELRQMPDGRLLAPTSPNHQADDAESLADSAEDLTRAALERVARMLPDHPVTASSVTLALRPVPRDGLPVVGATGPEGLYIATMHSGVTLAAIIGELVAQEIVQGTPAALLAPYRPDRFQPV